MRLYRKIAALALILALLLALSAPCLASGSGKEYDFEGKTLDDIMGEFMAEYGLNEENFTMGWYDTGTGEAWYFNPDKYLPAGSMYKLPINMIFAEYIAEGKYSKTDSVGSYTVDRAMYASLVSSDNAAAQALRQYISADRDTYRTELAKYSGIAASELPEEFFSENCMSPRFMLETLKCLYDDQELFATVIEYMKLAQPEYYFSKYDNGYTIAHKYGNFGSDLNDCGIVFTPTPFLLVVFTKGVAGCEGVLGAVCELMTEYSLYLDAKELEAQENERKKAEAELRRAEQKEQALKEAEAMWAEEQERLAAERAADEAKLAELQQKHEKTRQQQARIICTAAVCVLVIGGAALAISWKRKRR